MSALPSLFISHGAPTFALEPGTAGRQLRALGRELPALCAVLVVSPHWLTEGVEVTANPQPQTLHDFSGFDRALYKLEYPAPGAPELAGEIVDLLNDQGWNTSLNLKRGRDHGAWVPLLHLLPDARVPVLQVSQPTVLDGAGAAALGRALAPLARHGVLIIGSGSLTHNLHDVFNGTDAPEYAKVFTSWIRKAVLAGDLTSLQSALTLAPHARRAHPTSEHYWPLVIAAAAGSAPPARVLEGGLTHGVLSMDAFVFGPAPQAG